VCSLHGRSDHHAKEWRLATVERERI